MTYVIKRTHDDGKISYYKKGAGDNNPIEKAQLYERKKDAEYRLKDERRSARIYRDLRRIYPHRSNGNLVANVEIVEVEVSIKEKQQC